MNLAVISRDVGLRGDAGLFRGLLDFLAVLVHAGEEINALPGEPLEAGDHIRQHLFIGMADVRRAVGVVDGGGDKKRLGHGDRMAGWRRGATVECLGFGGVLERMDSGPGIHYLCLTNPILL